MRESLREGVAVVTGGASGVGRAVALRFAALGARVALADCDDIGLKATASELERSGALTLWSRVDVTDLEDLKRFAKDTADRLGPPLVLVNCAGTAVLGGFDEIEPEAFERVVSVNLGGVVNGCRAFLPGLLERGRGHIVNVASLAGLWPVPFASAYTASKFAVVGFSEALRAELAAAGVGVTVVCPGRVRTPIAQNALYRGRFRHFRPALIQSLERGGQSPDRLARKIVAGVRRNRPLLLPSTGAWAVFLVKRALPVGSSHIARLFARYLLSQTSPQRSR